MDNRIKPNKVVTQQTSGKKDCWQVQDHSTDIWTFFTHITTTFIPGDLETVFWNYYSISTGNKRLYYYFPYWGADQFKFSPQMSLRPIPRIPEISATRLTGQHGRLVRDHDSTAALSPLAGKKGARTAIRCDRLIVAACLMRKAVEGKIDRAERRENKVKIQRSKMEKEASDCLLTFRKWIFFGKQLLL